MRWIPFLVFAFVATLAQTTLAGMIAVSDWRIAPDLLAILAVFVALHVRSAADAMLAGWTLGLALDLTAEGGPAALTAIGPMALAFTLAARLVYQVREAIFRERMFSQALLVWAFCLVSHGLWITLQFVRTGGFAATAYGSLLLQALAVSVYSAVVAPLVYFVLVRIRGWLVIAPRGRARR